ncbi:hypothetical protein F441_14324 [Phytophthora nicotianae CJ01A1]|uniref:Uncharacterized protein n=5 Tax=Phytophthora nicotianae TaxID=4792 RepID=V9ELF4_PHYNI|nr:hypothetical protein F443_14446 [Phytophthora nicotianae P1569]ETK80153.1 hypothetical protein L915_14094 [Phytophthora nicotianae]ETO68789.1 hypothetical protein F444_14444 [Phytophthora nicotianae P1976]ETP09870.1 hypothetical protein F441_14324 [Phytophthora nicotianae CJ01A1]ETP37976.1 hypothetical protein F442_14289 [Phytophthora nicotianae P10297]
MEDGDDGRGGAFVRSGPFPVRRIASARREAVAYVCLSRGARLQGR